MLPTPMATDVQKTAKNSKQNSLQRMFLRGEMLPTPTVNGNYNRKGLSEKSGDGLSTAITALPTDGIGMKLQPRFAEWLMGYPDGWMDVTEPAD